jgi:hypothetical protein
VGPHWRALAELRRGEDDHERLPVRERLGDGVVYSAGSGVASVEIFVGSLPTSARVGFFDAGALSPTLITGDVGWTSKVIRTVTGAPPAAAVLNSAP